MHDKTQFNILVAVVYYLFENVLKIIDHIIRI